MAKKIIRTAKNKLAKFTPEEIKNIVTNVVKLNNSPQDVMERLKEFSNENPNFSHVKKDRQEEFSKIIAQTLAISNLKNNYLLTRVTSSKLHQTVALQMADELMKEFDCQKPSERALVHVIVNAYIRAMEFSEMLNNALHQDYLSQEKNSYFGLMSKEVERAERQYVSALNALVQMKRPPMKVNIKTNTAFVADKQQLNINTSTDEKIKPT